MAIEQAPNNSTIQNPRKRFVFLFGSPFRDNHVAFGKTANVQTMRIGRATAKTGIFRGVFFLKRWFSHGVFSQSVSYRDAILASALFRPV